MYDMPRTRTYIIAANDFGTTVDVLKKVIGPPGLKGRVRDVWVDNVTETFVGTTSGGQVLVGLVGNTDAYFASTASLLSGSSPAVGVPINLPTTLSGTEKGDNDIPAGTIVYITLVACVDGDVTGKADVHVTIDWF